MKIDLFHPSILFNLAPKEIASLFSLSKTSYKTIKHHEDNNNFWFLYIREAFGYVLTKEVGSWKSMAFNISTNPDIYTLGKLRYQESISNLKIQSKKEIFIVKIAMNVLVDVIYIISI